MSKTTITRLFGAAIALVVVGLAIGIVAVVTALANGAVEIGGPGFVTINGGPFAGAVVALVVASLVGGAGALVAIASWLGALWNTWQFEDKTWFAGLLVLGFASLGWIAMVAYVAKGPDSTLAGALPLGDATGAGASRP